MRNLFFYHYKKCKITIQKKTKLNHDYHIDAMGSNVTFKNTNRNHENSLKHAKGMIDKLIEFGYIEYEK